VADDSLRDHIIAPILAGVRSPRMGRKPKIWTAVDRDSESLRIGMQTLFQHVGIETLPAGTVCLIPVPDTGGKPRRRTAPRLRCCPGAGWPHQVDTVSLPDKLLM
jgi:hypothetical protein